MSTASRTRPFARSTLDRMLTKAIRVRLIIAPLLSSLALTFAFFEPTPWRKMLLVASVGVLISLSFVEWVRYLRYGLRSVLVPVNVLLTVVAQLALLTASGGLFSPVVPAVLVMAMLTAWLAELGTLLALLAIAVPYLWLLVFVHASGTPVDSLMPQIYGGAQALEHSIAPYVAATLYTLMMLAVARVGKAIQQVFEEVFNEAVDERDRSLALHAEQNRTLTLLSSEIAHELKNPLASIKGLAALVAKDVQGRAAERTQVLRGEVDRMQTILDEFLNFSRPLVPLSLAPTDLGALARDVARLHEGNAAERGVGIEVTSDASAQLACDARKIRQVLINLVQNALEASPRGGSIALRVESTATVVRVAVADQGPGLSPELGERVFEAGVTGKEHGSGMGLLVARGLARQHGGEIALESGASGGLIASLQLPRNVEAAR
ncbi:MAG TPA: HAMP domain-containing sensor histidine kinase [Polyangiales bacterium]|nr:HAMP domain-containing sensor histidine kinase [Polyangiales bacterium]